MTSKVIIQKTFYFICKLRNVSLQTEQILCNIKAISRTVVLFSLSFIHFWKTQFKGTHVESDSCSKQSILTNTFIFLSKTQVDQVLFICEKTCARMSSATVTGAFLFQNSSILHPEHPQTMFAHNLHNWPACTPREISLTTLTGICTPTAKLNSPTQGEHARTFCRHLSSIFI